MIISVPNSWNFSHKSFVSKWHWIGFNSSQLQEPKSVGRVCWRKNTVTAAKQEKEKECVSIKEPNYEYERYNLLLNDMVENVYSVGFDLIKTTY